MTTRSSVAALVLVKNEENFLSYSLESIAGVFDKIVIYSVNSTDRTNDIIAWFVDKEHHRTEFILKFPENEDPIEQGKYRNDMIDEGARPLYVLVDGDEIYTKPEQILEAASIFQVKHRWSPKKAYGVFRRTEIVEDLTQAYDIKRTHHRLYHAKARWEGPHPGERPVILQKEQTEVDFPDINVWHFHNTNRSRLDRDVPKRVQRRSQKTYHPGTPVPINLLEEVPLLRKPIEDFPVNPYLRKLQEEYYAASS